jgi:hypothetical protein
MPLKPMRMQIIRKPTPIMMRYAKSMAIAKAESEKARALGTAHILAQEAELEMYKHAMNLSEEMWKHYNQKASRAKRPSPGALEGREQAEIDFMLFSQKYETLKRLIQRKMTPTRVRLPAQANRWN